MNKWEHWRKGSYEIKKKITGFNENTHFSSTVSQANFLTQLKNHVPCYSSFPPTTYERPPACRQTDQARWTWVRDAFVLVCTFASGGLQVVLSYKTVALRFERPGLCSKHRSFGQKLVGCWRRRWWDGQLPVPTGAYFEEVPAPTTWMERRGGRCTTWSFTSWMRTLNS